MARYTGPKIKQCRREGMNLFFLGQNTSSGKVAVLQRRDYPPGVHAQSRRKVTEYGVRLREKQKLKRLIANEDLNAYKAIVSFETEEDKLSVLKSTVKPE